ncbi:MAG: carboxylesterase family protein, partial [Lachnospiraceae bacterium]|nr:carboxylesterase family protein [Lachnospiraceae bacterium]
MVVIYGGGNMKGQTNEKELDGTEFAKRGIVVVT